MSNGLRQSGMLTLLRSESMAPVESGPDDSRRPEQGRAPCFRNSANASGRHRPPVDNVIREKRPQFRQERRLLVPAYGLAERCSFWDEHPTLA